MDPIDSLIVAVHDSPIFQALVHYHFINPERREQAIANLASKDRLIRLCGLEHLKNRVEMFHDQEAVAALKLSSLNSDHREVREWSARILSRLAAN